ncbi:MAG: DUF2065 family protein [Paracoccaceae bacterium]
MSLLLLGLGLVLVVEGLVLALLPARLDTILALLAALGQRRRRAIGLAALGAGVVLVWAFAP